MRKLLLIMIIALPYVVFSQNIGQKGDNDTLLNYTDIQGMKKAGRLALDTLDLVEARIRPGMGASI